MEGDRRLSLVVGSFVIATLGLFAVAILALTGEQGLFTPQYTLLARFENVQGLLPGAPVWLAGKEVGRVEQVELVAVQDREPPAPLPGAEPAGLLPPLEVVLRIDESVQQHIRADSVATIGTIGVLGDSYVEIGVGGTGQPVLQAGDSIHARTPANLATALASGTAALDNIATLSGKLNEVVTNFAADDGGKKAAEALAAVSDMAVTVKEGGGLLHSLIYDDYPGGGIESVQASLETLESILDEIRYGDGILHALIYDSPRDQDIVMEAVEAGAKLNSILGKVDRGEGTMGLLVNDPTLYEDIKTLVGGAQRSTVVRTLIRMAVEGEEEDEGR